MIKKSKMSTLSQDIIETAISIRCNDIHILPEEVEDVVYFRTPVGLHEFQRLQVEEGRQLIAYFKYLADMDVGEHRRPQSGSYKFCLDDCCRDLRVSTMTNVHDHESMVIRILNPMHELDLRTHSFFPELIDDLESLVRVKSGLILFSGPVGSGKTSTMYQLIRQECRESKKSVICIEDPVEIEEPAFLQIQVNDQAGITYESLLKQSLRHHPDIIVIGEIRDEETAHAVIRGALTGHLILATVHAKDAEGVLTRLLELGLSRTMLDQVLIGVIFQKMLPRYCQRCQKNSDWSCDHIEKSKKQSVLFDVRKGDTLKQLGKQAADLDFNHWLRKAVENGYITERTFDQFAIPTTSANRSTD